MQILENTTPFHAAPFVATDKEGAKSCVVVVKGSFDVDSQGVCRPSDRQASFVFRDDHYGEPGATSIRYEADFSPVKPRVDILVVGEATSPGGRPIEQLDVALLGPGISKRARVTGDREWGVGPAGIRASSPRPFVSMPLIWERAFGGTDDSQDEVSRNGSDLRNPVGRGFHLNEAARSIIGRPLPNIERPESPVVRWSDKPEPIGFGPLGRGWEARIRHAGTYDARWMAERLPFLPEDFDDRYFQSAPLDQQLPEAPEGATLACVNMTREGRFLVRLPRFAIPVRFLFHHRSEAATVKPDTLVLEPAGRRLVLVGRAAVPLPRKLNALRGIQVGSVRRVIAGWKPHYGNLAEAIDAKRAAG